MTDTAWMAYAARKGMTDLFFTERGEDVSTAQAVCRECPVHDECLDYGIAHPGLQGIWGGAGHERRSRMRRTRRLAS